MYVRYYYLLKLILSFILMRFDFRWLTHHEPLAWEAPITCWSPSNLAGQDIAGLEFPELCHGQWASMTNLHPRLPVKTPSAQLPAPSAKALSRNKTE